MTIQDEIQRLLPETCPLGREIHFYEEIDSTNRLAKELAADGAAEGTVILADRQSAGRGRLGKSFHSPAGGLYLSVIVRPDLYITDMMAVTACAATAVHAALQDFGIIAKIKWVNDLFLHDRKICGILCEGGFQPGTAALSYLVIGIGLNLQPDAALPPELAGIVTDLATETGQSLSRNAVTAAILHHLHRFLSEIGKRTFLSAYTEHSYTIGKRVIVSRPVSDDVSHETKEECARAIGYTSNAGLIVQFADGTYKVITSGTARFADE